MSADMNELKQRLARAVERVDKAARKERDACRSVYTWERDAAMDQLRAAYQELHQAAQAVIEHAKETK